MFIDCDAHTDLTSAHFGLAGIKASIICNTVGFLTDLFQIWLGHKEDFFKAFCLYLAFMCSNNAANSAL